jgi:hypothetical protein
VTPYPLPDYVVHAAVMVRRGHTVTGMTRSDAGATALANLGAAPPVQVEGRGGGDGHIPDLPRHCLHLPARGDDRSAEKRSLLRMEFRTFCAALIQGPCSIVRGARRIVYRLLSWNPWQGVFLRLVERLHGCRLC